MSDLELNPLKLREIILNTRKPLVLKQFPINWSCFNNGLEEWCKIFDNANVSAVNFEKMAKKDANEPQWERKRQTVEMTAKEFLKEYKDKDSGYWAGLNYKRRHELPVECTNGIDFSIFGFSHAAEDATLWLSSEGANTPCHYDSYGCNIVVQIFGKKSWLLFPPNTPLTTTRIPYEESSIYCKENFYAPAENIKYFIENLRNFAHHVILEPNDVLIVPKHWWHYVEAVDISLSVNAWIPLANDLDQQIEECIIKFLIENFVKNFSTTTKQYVMNPNQLMNICSKEELFKILKYLIDQSLESDCNNSKISSNVYNYHYLSETRVEEMLTDFNGLLKVDCMSSFEFENFLKTNNNRRYNNKTNNKCEENCLDFIEEILINSICSPSAIEIIKQQFFNRYTTQQ
ncbi:HSPB1 associated protein 1 [Cochliomyia hominivorax]